ncbi:hypothetical protein VO54_03704 [Elizabethkingia miricola]|nr:hypothetical protein VO54_03704 [Elizabethkingia miricola]
MIDLTKYSVSTLYSRNKSRSYKESIIARSTALLLFLKNNNLISKDPIDENGNLKLDFIVKESDLTLEGLELFKKAIPSWMRGTDRGRDPEDISSLLRALGKIRKK